MMLSQSHWDEAHTRRQSPHHSSIMQDGQAPETEMTDASKSHCQLTKAARLHTHDCARSCSEHPHESVKTIRARTWWLLRIRC